MSSFISDTRFEGNQIGNAIQNLYRSDSRTPLSNSIRDAPLPTLREDITFQVKLTYHPDLTAFTVHQHDVVFSQNPKMFLSSEVNGECLTFSPFTLNYNLRKDYRNVRTNLVEFKNALYFKRGINRGKWDIYGEKITEGLPEEFKQSIPEYISMFPDLVNVAYRYAGILSGEELYAKRNMISAFENNTKKSKSVFSMLETVWRKGETRMRSCITGLVFPSGKITAYFYHDSNQKLTLGDGCDDFDKGPVQVEFHCSHTFGYRPTFKSYTNMVLNLDHGGPSVELDPRPSQNIGIVAEWDEYVKKSVVFYKNENEFENYKNKSEILSINLL